MTLKSILSVAAVAALTASTAVAQPSFTVQDGGLGTNGRIFNVLVTPGTPGNSVAVEIGLDGGGAVNSNTSIATAGQTSDFEDDGIAPVGNPGNNPFTGTTTDGIQVSGQTIFASLGSSILLPGETQAYSFEINDPIGVFEVALPGLIAEGGVNNALSAASFGIFGDIDLDGVVGGIDFAEFGAQFGAMNDPGNPFDFEGDGNVGGIDFAEFGARFGLNIANNTGGGLATAVPEPSSLIVLSCGLLGLVSRRRR